MIKNSEHNADFKVRNQEQNQTFENAIAIQPIMQKIWDIAIVWIMEKKRLNLLLLNLFIEARIDRT